MRVKLFHNPNAGPGGPDAAELRFAFGRQGIALDYHPTPDADLRGLLEGSGDVIAIAGGDGTVRKVCKQMHRLGMCRPLLILPVGTMNNIARSLDAFDPALELIADLDLLSPLPFHYHRAVAAGLDEVFFESAGVGAWAKLLGQAEDCPSAMDLMAEGREGAARDFASLAVLTQTLESVEIEFVSGEERLRDRYLLAEVMNIPFVGAQLHWGTRASLDGAVIQVALVPENNRRALVEYFRAKADGGEATFPGFHRNFTSRIDISLRAGAYHADDAPSCLVPAGRVAVSVERVPCPFAILRRKQDLK